MADDGYTLQTPAGQSVPITKEVYWAFLAFLKSEDRPNGSVTVHFKTGALIGVESLVRKVYK